LGAVAAKERKEGRKEGRKEERKKEKESRSITSKSTLMIPNNFLCVWS